MINGCGQKLLASLPNRASQNLNCGRLKGDRILISSRETGFKVGAVTRAAPCRLPCYSCSGCEPCRHKSQLAIKNLELQEAARASAAGQRTFRRLTLDHLASSFAGLQHELALAAADAAAVRERERALRPLANSSHRDISTCLSTHRKPGNFGARARTHIRTYTHTHTHTHTHTQQVNNNV